MAGDGTHGQLIAVPKGPIEVQTVIDPGKDHIIRYEDFYARG